MDRSALYAVLDGYLAALAQRDAAAVRWADGALTSENNVMLAIGDGLWGTIEDIGSYALRSAWRPILQNMVLVLALVSGTGCSTSQCSMTLHPCTRKMSTTAKPRFAAASPASSQPWL